ncbi:murein L,D-transpeptidase catalytic domain family protein [Lysobacter korlensis]|uniref:Murein L,D-transpeptidase catalytic domain family protein n=1 Tax=Lysobacter korlensis TaxID=553636 RepID=A0ABV6RHC8_9GAMM
MLRPALITAALAAAVACSSHRAPQSHTVHAPEPAAPIVVPPTNAIVASPTETVTPAPRPQPAIDTRLTRLQAIAPDLDPGVLALALQARECASRSGTKPGDKLAVIDYSRPSTQPRLWVFDVERARLLHREHVAHGRGSGENHARAFSNRDGSHQTSLGLFTTAETYVGGNGYSLRMDGLDAGVNDAARDRLIVMHGAPYVDPAQAQRQGRLGRSYGCPAVRPEVARQMIDTLKHGQMLFAYYPDDAWLSGSRHFRCSGRNGREIYASARQAIPGGGGSASTAAAAQ